MRAKTGRCGKRFYKDELAAMIALASTQKRAGSSRRDEKRYYYCKQCKGYHLTSQGMR